MKIRALPVLIICNLLLLSGYVRAAHSGEPPAKRLKTEHDQIPKVQPLREKPFKVVLVSDEHGSFLKIVPKESFIRKVVSPELWLNYINVEGLLIEPYGGEPAIAEQIKKLPVFEDDGLMIPLMKNGHLKRSDCGKVGTWDRMDRGYFICDPEKKVKACVHFAILMDSDVCVLESLGVDRSVARQGLGASLLQTAIYVASLYGCDDVELQSTEEAVGTYAKHGFWFIDCGYSEEDAVWQDFATLKPEQLNEIAAQNDYFMKLDFRNEKHLKILDQYMARYAKPVAPLSELIKSNLESIAFYGSQLEKLMACLNEEDPELKICAREIFLDMAQQVEFPQDVVEAIALN